MTIGNIAEPIGFDDAPSFKGNAIVLQPEEGADRINDGNLARPVILSLADASTEGIAVS